MFNRKTGKGLQLLLSKETFSAMFKHTEDLWLKNVDRLSDIDSRFGDGDHGITIGKIARAISECMENWNDESIHETIVSLSEKILGISGGSAGPLYGTLIGGLALPLSDETAIDAELLKKMLQGCYDEMTGITKARVGDKTMMDALIPAVEAAVASDGDIPAILSAAAEAAALGAAATENFASKFGRARSYGDKTIGTQDAGAVSTSLLFQGLYEGLVSQKITV